MSSLIRKLFFITIFLVLIGGNASPDRAGAQSAGPDPRFGATEAFWAPDDAAELGIGWERILFYWREIQPTGPEDWNTLHVLEEWLDEADDQGRTVVGLLKNTAPWASSDGTEAGIPQGLYLPIDDPGNLWAGFVRKIAQYYRVRGVHHWIIWNEPEIDRGVFGYEFGGSVEDYYQLVKVAYQIMKAEDPEAVIHLAGLTWWHDPAYLNELLNVILADPEARQNDYFFDVVSLHIYFRVETVATIIDSVEAILDKWGVDKPIWINETNAAPNRDPLWPINRPQFQLDLEQQAWYIIQATALGFASGAENISIYKMMDVLLPEGGEPFGLMRPDFSRRPAFDAYRTIIDYLSGFRGIPDLEQKKDYYVITFFRPQGITRVIWARNPVDVTLQLPAIAEYATKVGVTGDTVRMAARRGAYNLVLEGARCYGECLVGGRPIIIFEEGASLNNSPLTPAIQIGEAVPVPTFSFDFFPTATPTAEPTLTPTPIPTMTSLPSPTVTRSPTATVTKSPVATLTEIPTIMAPITPTDEDPQSLLSPTPIPGVDRNDLVRTGELFLLAGGVGAGLLIGFFILTRLKSR